MGCFKIQKCKTHTRSCHRWNVSSQPGVFGGLSMAIVGAKHFYFAKNTYTSWQAHTQFAEFVWVRSPRQVHANFATTSSCLRVFPSFLAGCWYSSWFSYSPIQDLPCRFAFAVGQIIFHNTLHTVKLFLLLYPQLVAAHTREMNGVFQRAQIEEHERSPSRNSRGKRAEREVPLILHRNARFEWAGRRSAPQCRPLP